MPEFTCHVTNAGSSSVTDEVMIGLEDTGGAFPGRWFLAAIPKRREFLATALTAISTGYPVYVEIESTNEFSRLLRLFITGVR